MAPDIQLTYAVPIRRYRQFAWIMLLAMGIVNLFLGTLTALAMVLQYVLYPGKFSHDSIDFPRLLLGATVMSFGTLIAAVIYFWCSHAVYRRSRFGTGLGRNTAAVMAVLYAMFSLVDPVLLVLHKIQIDNLAQFILAILLRIVLVVASGTLAWLLSRYRAEVL